jgi:signal transduction histidine kinase
VNPSVTPEARPGRIVVKERAGKILVVDDHESSLFWRCNVLTSAGHTVWEARTLGEAMVVIQEFRPDLVVLDVNLPDGNGMEFCRSLKADDELQAIMVLQMSASFTSSDDQARSLDSGADAFLADPVPPNVLVATAHAMLRVSRAEHALKHALQMEQQARMDAEAANRAKDDFLAALSHELRTPLNAIIGWVELIQKMEMDAAARDRALEVIERNARSQAALIEDLLDVSRITKGQVQLRAEQVYLPAVVGAAIDTVGPSASAKDIALESSVTGEAYLTIQGDGARLQQVVWNLLSNSVKFTPKGGRVEVVVTGDPTSAVVVVTDTGRGMDADALKRVFDRFYRTAPMVGASEGLGLGLTIARQLVQMHGGTLTVSSPGRDMGTSFVIRLPRTAGGPPPTAEARRSKD